MKDKQTVVLECVEDKTLGVGFSKESNYITEARKKAIEYLGTRWVLHPQSTYTGNYLKHA